MTQHDASIALHTLTAAECRVLYWRCQGLTYEQIAQKLFVAERTVYFHMGHVYEKLSLQNLSSSQRMLILSQLFCPLLRAEIEDPEVDCKRRRETDPTPPIEPSSEVLALVVYDNRVWLVPVDEEPPPGPNPYLPDIYRWPPPPPPPPPPVDPVRKWLVIGILIGALAVLLAVWRLVPGAFVLREEQAAAELAETLTSGAVPTVTPVVGAGMTGLPTQTAPTTLQPTAVAVATTQPTNTSIPVPSMALPFEDSFDNGARPEWQPQSGVWRMVNGMYKADPSDDMQVTLVGDDAWTDYAVDVDVHENGIGGYPVRVIVRAQGGRYVALETACCESNLVVVGDGPDRIVAHSDTGGLKNRVYEWTQSHLRVEVRGDIYTAYSDGTLLFTAQEGTLTRGMVGLGMQCPYDEMPLFEDFQVTSLE
jgi:DNA-binding CsgD family transcriptional regulator